MKAFLHKIAFPLYTPGYFEDQWGTCMTASRYVVIRMPKFLAPQDILKCPVFEKIVRICHKFHLFCYLPESAKTVEEGWPADIKNPK